MFLNKSHPTPFFKTAVLLLLSLLLLIPPQVVHADPADMYAQSQSITLSRAGIRIDWKVAPGPVLADAIWAAADTDHNNLVSPQEAEAWMAPFVTDLSVQLDGQALGAPRLQSVHWPQSVGLLRTGQDAAEVVLSIPWPAGLSGAHALVIHSAHVEANSLDWFSLASQDGLSFETPSQDNGLLKVSLDFPPGGGANSHPLTAWNSGMPNMPSGVATLVSNAASHLTNAQATAPQAPTTAPTTSASTLTSLLQSGVSSPIFLIGAFLLSLVLGSLHGLTPGHGKTLVAAYLVGSHGRVRDAAFLGLVVTLTHTGSVLILGLITLLASHFILPALIAPWLEVASGVLVIAFGVNLLLQRRRDLAGWIQARRVKPPAGFKSVTIAARPMGTSPVIQAHDHPHAAAHPHSHAPAGSEITWRSLLALGVSGGLVPCPDAIAILLVAVAVNRIPFGMLLIVAFSIGLALVLIAIGIAMVQGVRWMARSDLLARFSLYTPVLSAVLVIGLGGALTLSAWNSVRFAAGLTQSPGSGQPASAAAPAFDIGRARLLYLAPDANGQDQLFMIPLSGGTPLQYTQETFGISGYSVSPDGSTILYTVFNPDGDSAIWSMRSDGTGKSAVLDCPQTECDSPAWYPDGQRVVYEHMSLSQAAAVPRFSLWWLDLATRQSTPVFQDQGFASSAAGFSPDGRRLGYISFANNTLQLYDLQSGQSVSIPLGNQSVIPEVWSPSGDSILFGTPRSSETGAPLHIQRYILSSGQTLDLGLPALSAAALGASADSTDYSAAWSPDGSWIAIDRDVAITAGAARSNQVWLVKPDGTQAHVLLDAAGASYSDLKWSADGKYLIYSRYSYASADQNVGHFDIYLADVGSGTERLLVSGGDIPTLLP
jgi:nickel/cobalt transporter (NicO) family protein